MQDSRAGTRDSHLGDVTHLGGVSVWYSGQALGCDPGDRGFPSGEATSSLGILRQALFPSVSHGVKGVDTKSCFSTLAALRVTQEA